MFPIAMPSDNTVARMGRTKRVEARYIASVARHVRRFIDERHNGNQSRAAEALGVSQGHLSQIVNAAERGPGLPFLVALRNKTGTPIDDLLGLEPLTANAPAPTADLDAIRSLLREELAAAQTPKTDPPEPPAPSKKGPSDAPRARRR
jgi:transcriptional regulator with XRE-family HTH domain